MSRHTARIVLDQISGRPALLAPQYAGAPILPEVTSNGLLADLRELSAADAPAEEARWVQRKRELLGVYGFGGDPDDSKPFAFGNGKAIIPVHGLLINRFAYSWSFCTGYNFIRNQLAAAVADPDVDGIVLDVNSYGGTAAGAPETAAAIYAARRSQGGKPILAVVDSNCFSAAYYVASQADRLVVTPSGSAGSVGVVMMHVDLSKALDDMGVKITFIQAGSHKTDGNPFEPLPDDVREEFQQSCDSIYDAFVADVARGRIINEQDIRDTEARCYLAEDALDLSLIDAIENPDDAVESFFSADPEEVEEELDDDTDPNDPDNPERNPAVAQKPTNQPAPGASAPQTEQQPQQAQHDTAAQAAATAAQAAADARTAERQRIQGIQGHAEAAGRESLASHLALNTDLSVEQAAGILAASPKQEAKTENTPAPQQTNHFKNAMDNTPNPNVGAGSGNGGTPGGQEMTPAQRILAAQTRATGVRPPQRTN